MRHKLIFLLLVNNFEYFSQEIAPQMLKRIQAKEIKMDSINADGVFLAWHKKTNKCGMFQAFSAQEIHEMIPMLYDSIDFFQVNAFFTGVWMNGKVGIYSSPWVYEIGNQTVQCLYEDYKIYTIQKKYEDGFGGFYEQSISYLALKKDGFWAWADWMSGEVKTDFLYDAINGEMPYPEFDQSN